MRIVQAYRFERVLADPALARQLVENACRKVKAFHTTAQRVKPILHWGAGGEAPTYGITDGVGLPGKG